MRKSKKQLAIEHYDRMIQWVKDIKPKTFPFEQIMEWILGESWKGSFCVYCRDCGLHCGLRGECKLSSNKICFGSEFCCDGLWLKMHTAKTVKTWLKYAEKVREYIRQHG